MAKIPTIINIRKKATFSFYIDNYYSLIKIFEYMHEFVYKIYFLYIAFRQIFFIRYKLFGLDNSFDILGF